MARTKQTTRRSKSRRTISVPVDEVVLDGEQRDFEESGSDEEAPTTSGSSSVREVDGEEAASSNGTDDAEAGEGSRAESSGFDQDNFAADYQHPPKVADHPNPKRTRMLPAVALKMVDPAKTPAKLAALLHKEAAIAKKAAVDAKNTVKRVPRSFSKLLKRQGDDLEKAPVAKAAKKDPPPRTSSAAKSDRPATGGKSPSVMKILSESSERSHQKAPDASTTSKGGLPPNVADGAATTGEEHTPTPHPDTQGKGRIEIPWPLDFMRFKTKVDPSGGSVSSRQRMSANYVASYSQSTTFDANLTSDEPDLVGFAKRMIIAVELKQEELIRSLMAANDEANSRADDLEKKLKDAKFELKALEDADQENTQLRANSLLYPDIDFEVYKLRYDYTTEVYDAQVLGKAPPPRFKDWAAEQGYEVSDNDEPAADEQNEGPTGQNQPEHQYPPQL
ncbi:protein IWS1 homolog [Chenopodium quinoa]|uniref:protein IWS1 homolog n=1 Tax=Chenopodium quinoa TaxID=63459 RepID=UPI000B792E3F|nr:protein IWS1 homolog [Chenopodium quinoa]